jgi:hypothetical protein
MIEQIGDGIGKLQLQGKRLLRWLNWLLVVGRYISWLLDLYLYSEIPFGIGDMSFTVYVRI